MVSVSERKEMFIGGILEAVDINAQIFTGVMSRLIKVEQLVAANTFKTDQTEEYLVANHRAIARALGQINENDVAQDNELWSELNAMSARLHEAHGELEGKLAALATVVSGMGGGLRQWSTRACELAGDCREASGYCRHGQAHGGPHGNRRAGV